MNINVDFGCLGVRSVAVEYYVKTNPNGSSWSISISDIYWGPIDVMALMSSDEIDNVLDSVKQLIEGEK